MVISAERTMAADTIGTLVGSNVLGEDPVGYRFGQHPYGAPCAQQGQSRSSSLPASTSARAQRRKQCLRDHHGEPGRQRRTTTLEELRGGVPPDVEAGDPLRWQVVADGDACADR